MRSRRIAHALSPELRSFVVVGLACTAAYAALYTALRDASLPASAANAVALAATMGVNFAANRRWTFNAGGGRLAPQLAGYAIAYCVGLAASTVVLAALLVLLGHPRGAADTAAGVTAGLAATLVRYTLMRRWVFAAAGS